MKKLLLSTFLFMFAIMTPIGFVSADQAAAPLHEEGFEGAIASTLYTLNTPYGTLTKEANQVIAGTGSIKGLSARGTQWAEYASLNKRVQLTAGKDYTISFKYRILEQEGNFFYFYMKQQVNGADVTSGFNFKSGGTIPYRAELAADQVRLTEKDGYWLAEASFKAAGDGLYNMLWGIQDGGAIVIDDVLIKEGKLPVMVNKTAAVAIEGFESGDLTKTSFQALGSGALVQQAKAIQGKYAVGASATVQQEWHEFLATDPAKLELAANTVYTVMFKYKVVQPEGQDSYFYVMAGTGDQSKAMNFGSSAAPIWTNADAAEVADRGTYKVAKMTFKTGSTPDMQVKWGIRKGGAIAIDDVSIVKGKASIPTQEGPHIGYANVVDYGAVPNDGQDDTVAFQQAIATGKSIFVPAGVYHIEESLKIQNQNLIGSGMFVTKIVSRSTDAKAPILRAGRSSVVADLELSFEPGLISNTEGRGDRVGIYTAAQWSLQRGSTVRNVRISDVGTAIYSPNGAESFSVTYDTLEIEDFSYRGIDFSSDIRTGNVFNNIYLKSSRPNVDIPFALTGEESEVSIQQLNVEHTKVNTAILLEDVYGLAASTIHIEGVTLRNPDTGYITLDGSSGSVESLSVYLSPIEQHNTSIIRIGDSVYDIGAAFKPHSAAYLRVGTLHVKGLNDPNADLHGAKVGGLNRTDAKGFVFFDRPQQAIGEYTVQLDNYVWYTYQEDKDIYRAFPVDPNKRIQFTKLGVVPTSGKTSARPTNRLIPYVSTYYDTDLSKLLIWDGTKWRPVV